MDVTLLARYYERFADHAVEVAQRVIFLATGEYANLGEDDPEHSSTPNEELVRRFNETDRSYQERRSRHLAAGGASADAGGSDDDEEIGRAHV